MKKFVLRRFFSSCKPWYFKNTMTFHLFSRLLFKLKKVSFRSMSNKIENAFSSWHSVFLLPPPPLIHLLILIVLLNFPSSTNTERQLLLTVDSSTVISDTLSGLNCCRSKELLRSFRNVVVFYVEKHLHTLHGIL